MKREFPSWGRSHSVRQSLDLQGSNTREFPLMDASAHRSINYRAKALPRRALRNEQAKIYRYFAGSFPPRPHWRVLEVGTNHSFTDPQDHFLQFNYPHAERFAAASLEEPDVFRSVFPRYMCGQVRRDAPLPFDDGSFDLVFSNAFVEHLGSRERQRCFVDEMLRVVKRAFITTPNRRPPIEFHTARPLLQRLPLRIYRRIYAAASVRARGE